MAESRIKNTSRNIITSYLDYILTFLFQFISRTIIVNCLGEQYLGLSSLFTSILQVLNMAELGFASAIVFNMYKPLAEGDVEIVCRLLNYYKKVYKKIALIVLCIGMVVTPFIKYLINGIYPNDINIYILYYIYLLNTVSSYMFFAYKTSLLAALQRTDLVRIVYSCVHIAQYLLQIISLLVFANFYLYVIAMLAGTIIKNCCVEVIAKRRFNQYQCVGNISEKTKRDIISRVKGLMIGKISSVTYTTFDSIIISAFIGLSTVAVYNNYLVVVNGVMSVLLVIRTSMEASVGNSVASESKQKNYEDMLLWQFLFSVIATICTTCILCLFQPIMELWMGKEMLLDFPVVVLLCIWFYISVVQHSFYLYLGGNGLWWEMRWPYIFSTVFNLVMNFILGKCFGVAGIVFSTVAASAIFGLFWQCHLIFKYYFDVGMSFFQKRQIVFSGVCCLSCVAALGVVSLVNIGGYIGLLIKLLICLSVSVLIQIIVYCRTSLYKNAIHLIKKIVKS